MTQPILESIAQSLNHGDLPETWRVPEIERFSSHKTLYDYQADALRNAARALYLYYGKEHAWQPAEMPEACSRRKQNFACHRYGNQTAEFSIRQYERNADRTNLKQNPVFKILAEYMTPQGNVIPYHHLINRMCFWMATGSGKTLVMVKIIEYLHHLKQHRHVPPHNVLVLAPSDHLIGQIRRTIEEFNAGTRLNVDFVPLRGGERERQGRLGNAETVYYHRSDNISDVQKDALTDYRQYENDGRWYVLLDEAHKGGKEDSKRQAYYALMARNGFLFNFSATFTDPEDVVTTVKKYNLAAFIGDGHGKNIYLNEAEYRDFRKRREEISEREKTTIVLKSLITLACANIRALALREKADHHALYHLPLMLTLVNSVNTDVENERNDLWAFFSTLRNVASGGIDEKQFRESRDELLRDWRQGELLFGDANGSAAIGDEALLKNVKIPDLREAVFGSRRRGALQFIRSKDDRELAFQMKNADAPFALIRIGNTSKWRNVLLADFEEVTALRDKPFFDALEKSPITILMGSRAFFESWDSTRPNVINFINVGGSDAKKFVTQSVGRGVRIEPLANHRRRLATLLPSLNEEEQQTLAPLQDLVAPVETLSLFATNRSAISHVLEGLTAERSGAFEKVENVKKSERPVVNDRHMLLFVPEYKDKEAERGAPTRAKFAVSEETLNRLVGQLEKTSDSLLAVRDNLAPDQIHDLRRSVKRRENLSIKPDKDYANLSFLQTRLVSHLGFIEKTIDGVRKLDDEDIVHFREIRAQLPDEDRDDLREKIQQVAKGGISEEERRYLASKYGDGRITKETFEELTSGRSETSFKGLTIKNIAEHYYLPIIIAERGKADFIKHVVKAGSEVKFLNDLEIWLKDNQPEWDAWMFSKIDESLDEIHIPYYDRSVNVYRCFLPDFIFWMCRGHEYRIVFVDPKGMAYASVYPKIDGYAELFQENGKCRVFRTKTKPVLNVSVDLMLFNPRADERPAEPYARYWHDGPEAIFA